MTTFGSLSREFPVAPMLSPSHKSRLCKSLAALVGLKIVATEK